MKRISTLLLAAGLLAGCTETPTAPVRVRGALDQAGPLFSAATSSTANVFDFFFTETDFVACANGGVGEDVLLAGNLHFLSHTTITGAGQGFTNLHFQPQGLTGTGLTTGLTYRATGESDLRFDFATDVLVNFSNNFRLIAPGPGNNFLIHENVHITVNANGDVTASHDHLTFDCK
jgi:hypothetical protein